jgi:putative ABC transport system substrate-binding protein
MRDGQRVFINRLRWCIACALLACLPAAAVPQSSSSPSEPGAPIRIQVLQSSDETPYQQAMQGLRRGLVEALGPEGRGFELSIHLLAAGDDAKGAEAVPGQERANLIVSLGTAATKLARRIAQGRPVVFSMVVNPVTQGLYDPAQKEALTGVSMDVSLPDQFETLKRVLPKARRVGVVHQTSNSRLVERAREAAKAAGLELVAVPVDASDQIPAALGQLTGKIDVLWSFADSLVYSPHLAQFIILQTLRSRLPFMGVSPGYVKAGALFCVYADYEDVGRQSAEVVAEIAKGKSASGIPLQNPRRQRMAVNLTAAEAIGVDIPLGIRKAAAEKY